MEKILTRYDAITLKRAIHGLPYVELPASAFVRAIAQQGQKESLLELVKCLPPAALKEVMEVDVELDHLPKAQRDLFIHASALEKLEPVSWLVPGEIPERGLTVLYGSSGSGKSFLALDYALNIAQSHPVVYMAGEGQAGYAQRVAAWKQHHHQDEGHLYMYLEPVSISDSDKLTAFIDTIAPTQPKLVIIDTVARAMTGYDENSTRDMGLFIQAANQLMARLDCAVLLVHHTQKSGGQERGSSSLRGAADSMLKLSAMDDLLILECSKSKDGSPFDTRHYSLLSLEITLQGRQVSSACIIPAKQVEKGTDDKLSPAQRKILDTLAQDVNLEGLGREELRQHVDLSIGTLGRALGNLLKMKLVEQAVQRGPYTLSSAGRQRLMNLHDSHDSLESHDSHDSHDSGAKT
jgi:KaiC/GvpD/RAD55 family RecA-like ATPase